MLVASSGSDPHCVSSSSEYVSASSSVETASQIPSPFASTGTRLATRELLPHAVSSMSDHPSLSSSRSSVRVDSPVIVSGIPSPSVSVDALASRGKASASLNTVSPSISKSYSSHSKSPSKSSGDELALSGSVPQAVSIESRKPSLSSSVSSTSGGVDVDSPSSWSGNPSPSVSKYAASSSGNISFLSISSTSSSAMPRHPESNSINASKRVCTFMALVIDVMDMNLIPTTPNSNEQKRGLELS